MDSARIGGIVLAGLLFVLIAGGVYAYQRSQSEVLVDNPAVRITTNKASGETTVEAPLARVENDENGTRVQAPGVDANVPKQSSKNSSP